MALGNICIWAAYAFCLKPHGLSTATFSMTELLVRPFKPKTLQLILFGTVVAAVRLCVLSDLAADRPRVLSDLAALTSHAHAAGALQEDMSRWLSAGYGQAMLLPAEFDLMYVAACIAGGGRHRELGCWRAQRCGLCRAPGG
jgi:hypothetical protein